MILVGKVLLHENTLVFEISITLLIMGGRISVYFSYFCSGNVFLFLKIRLYQRKLNCKRRLMKIKQSLKCSMSDGDASMYILCKGTLDLPCLWCFCWRIVLFLNIKKMYKNHCIFYLGLHPSLKEMWNSLERLKFRAMVMSACDWHLKCTIIVL